MSSVTGGGVPLYDGNPNGQLYAALGQLVIDKGTGILYQQTTNPSGDVWGALTSTSPLAHVTATTNMQELVIAGLDGDLHGRYYIEGLIHVSVTSSAVFSFRPNGLNTGFAGSLWVNHSGTADATDMRFTNAMNFATGPIQLKFRTYVNAQKTVGGVATWRLFETDATAHYNVSGTYQTSYRSTGNWRESATNMTSLSIIGSVTGSILSGSQIMVYRTANRFTP